MVFLTLIFDFQNVWLLFIELPQVDQVCLKLQQSYPEDKNKKILINKITISFEILRNLKLKHSSCFQKST